MKKNRQLYFRWLAAAILSAFITVASLAQKESAQSNEKASRRQADSKTLQARAAASDETDTLADLDKEIEESGGVQSAQTQMTQQGQQIVTVDRSSMPNILAAVDLVGEKGLGSANAFDGLYVRSTEFGFFGAIDWWANGMVLFAMHREGNGYVFALHEASFEFPSLPWNLWMRVGRMFPDAGKLNTIHQHDRVFTGIPRVHGQLFDTVIGEGFLDTGGEIAWLAPLPFFSEFKFGLFNGRTFGHTHNDGFPKAAPLYLLRQKNFFPFTQGFGLQWGTTYLRYNVTRDAGDVDHKFGSDITLKYQRGRWESFELSGEIWYHTEERVASVAEKKIGFYVYLQYQPFERWKFGYRRDFFSRLDLVNVYTGRKYNGVDQGDALWVTYLTSEFFNVKLNVERQTLDSVLGDVWLIYTQAVYVLGFHPAHRF
ncbi:MAG: hypothetical protein OHK0011_25190 [Turneriella sp.]